MEERLKLAIERLRQIKDEAAVPQPYQAYFMEMAEFLMAIEAFLVSMADRDWNAIPLEKLQEENERWFADIKPEQYEKSFANPTYAVSVIGGEYGALFSFLYTELRSLIPYAYEEDDEEIVIRAELLLQIYHVFVCAYAEEGKSPKYEEVKQIIYWFVSDYYEPEMEKRIREQLDPEGCFAADIIMQSDLTDVRYLYRFGEYITENELQTARHLSRISEEQLAKMADTFTEGFRMGFVNGNKDLSKKKVVNIRYVLGFERMIKRVIENFARMGLQPTIYRASSSTFFRRGTVKVGYYGAICNKQYDFDHKEDEAIYWDQMLCSRRLEVLRNAYEAEKEWASVHAGPACVETFGETPFEPVAKKEALQLSKAQQKISVEYASKSGEIVNTYVKGEERSFTIIAFPIPEIGKEFEAIFDEVIKVNTLDYHLYETIQQTVIDTLDRAEYVHIQGGNGNKTDLNVYLLPLENPERETKFENCVADVNIPVGEIFTSPRLQGTTGLLHVSRVYLNELEYRELEIVLQDGMVESYTCMNFAGAEENRKYIKDNVLFHHDTLPLGEFAIGTNTTAYMLAKKYDIAHKLPILIAEKTGPHFALGDTCYSHSEEVKVYNPNGKEIVAKDNEVSILRKSDMARAYYHCHTDITIPYDELDSLEAVTPAGERIAIISQGRFVLKGCEDLNQPFFN